MAKAVKFHKKPIGLLDLLAFKKLVPIRQGKIDAAPADPIPTSPINTLSGRLHPSKQILRLSRVIEENETVRRYVLEPRNGMPLAPFRPGQYLSVSLEIGEARLTRPYSIASSPTDARKGFYEICVKNNGGFASSHIFETWKEGIEVVTAGPEGHFYYDEVRDTKKIIALAGGIGITPLRSIARAVMDGTVDADMILFYGCNTASEMLFAEEFAGYEASKKFKAIYVVANEEVKGAEKGFITADLIRKYGDPEKTTVMICGPQGMYRYLEQELESLTLTQKQKRRELFGEIKDVTACTGYPMGKESRTYTAKVRLGFEEYSIKARGDEPLMVALERAGLKAPSRCRSGECGFCRSLLKSGEVFIPPQEEARRMADRKMGYIHLCCSFPLSDVELDVPRARA